MPGWPLWCGVGLAKSSFMEGGRLKSSIHPAGIIETTKQPNWSQIQRPAILKGLTEKQHQLQVLKNVLQNQAQI